MPEEPANLENTVRGSCLCGAVRFRVELPTAWCGHCHCTMCQRNHGASHVTWFGVPDAQLLIEEGADRLHRYASSEQGSRSFCTECGTSLFCVTSPTSGEVDIPLANMEGPIDRPPGFHIYVDDHASWHEITDELPSSVAKRAWSRRSPVDDLNGDLGEVVHVRTSSMEWEPSPSGSVWRKRLHRVGPAEAGQVTSVVRYERGSSFPAHDHPDGEEILVLEGVFSDEHGDWPAGTYLMNPEGFRHAPFSREGCRLFVKLRQAPGARTQTTVALREDLPEQLLYEEPGFSDRSRLLTLEEGAHTDALETAGGAELFVVAGAVESPHGVHEAGDWLRVPSGERLALSARERSRLFLKTGGFAYL